jgi:hypothetical protein
MVDADSERTCFALAVSSGVPNVAESVVSGDDGALRVRAGLCVVAELVRRLAALGALPRGRQQVCGPLQQAVEEAQLALDAEAGVVRSVYRELLARALAGHSGRTASK